MAMSNRVKIAYKDYFLIITLRLKTFSFQSKISIEEVSFSRGYSQSRVSPDSCSVLTQQLNY